MLELNDTNNLPDQLPYHLPPKKRLDFIVNHPQPLKLVHSIKTLDIVQTIRDVGPESSLELVEMLRPDQVQEVLDLEIWSADRLSIEHAGIYFSLLFEANRDTAIAQIHGLDIELIGLMFKLVSDIYDASLGEEPVDFSELYSVSPDGRFIVCFKEHQSFRELTKALHTFLEELYGRDMSFALRMLENVRFELASHLEEESLRFRQHRMASLGILPFLERLEYFSPISRHEIKRLAAHLPKSIEAKNGESSLLAIGINRHIDDQYPFLQQAIFNSSDVIKENFWQGLTFACVNMHASLSGDFGDREAIIKTANYIKFLVELGLFHYSLGNLSESTESLLKTSPKYLIRLGRTALIALRQRLVAKTKDPNYLFGQDFCHADSPLREILQALNLLEPRYYEGLIDPKKLTIRHFASLSEVNATALALNEAIFRAGILGIQGLGFKNDHLKEHSDLAHASLFARVLVNSFNQNDNLLKPVLDHDMATLFVHQKLKTDFVNFTHDFAEKLAKNYADKSGRDRKETLEKTKNFLTAILIQIEQNWQLIL